MFEKERLNCARSTSEIIVVGSYDKFIFGKNLEKQPSFRGQIRT